MLGLIGLALASVVALLLFWMRSVKHESLRHEHPYSQGMADARSQEPEFRTNFRGDLIGYAKNSTALQAVHSESRVDLLTLANAGAVLHRDSDFSGNTPEYVKAFDCIAEDPAALLAFRELVANANPAGRIYGLCGLYLKRSAAFPLAREHLLRSARSLVWFQSSYDVIALRNTHEMAERPEDICRRLEGHERSAGQPRACNGRLTPHAEAPERSGVKQGE